jgi:hypothetical protein
VVAHGGAPIPRASPASAERKVDRQSFSRGSISFGSFGSFGRARVERARVAHKERR